MIKEIKAKRDQENTDSYDAIIAELPRAKRASEALWVRKIGNPSSRENLVMTSPYVRTSVRSSVRASVQTMGEGRGVSQ